MGGEPKPYRHRTTTATPRGQLTRRVRRNQKFHARTSTLPRHREHGSGDVTRLTGRAEQRGRYAPADWDCADDDGVVPVTNETDIPCRQLGRWPPGSAPSLPLTRSSPPAGHSSRANERSPTRGNGVSPRRLPEASPPLVRFRRGAEKARCERARVRAVTPRGGPRPCSHPNSSRGPL